MKDHRHGAFTLIEVLSVVAILSVLFALTFSVMSSAKQSAKETGAKMQLKQLHLATVLYRENCEVLAPYGDETLMGLPACGPPAQAVLETIAGKNIDRESPCGRHPTLPKQAETIEYLPRSSLFAAWARKAEENIVLWADANCNPPNVEVYEQFSLKKVYAVTLGGSLIARTRNDLPYWSPDYYGTK